MSYPFPYLLDVFGRCYRLYHWSQGPLPKVAKAWPCSSEHYALQFLTGLDAPNDFWAKVLRMVQGEGQVASATRLEQCWAVARLLAQQQLFAYEIPSPRLLANTRGLTRFHKDDRSAWQFCSPASLDGDPKPLRSFHSLDEARAFLNELNPSSEQLKALKQLSFGNHWNPAQPKNAIARELVEGNLIVVEEPVTTAPPEAANSDDPTWQEMPALASATLGPHAQKPDEPPERRKENKEETPVCELKHLTLRCNHLNERGYLLDVLHAEPNHNGKHKVIQVVSQRDADADQINLSFDGFCGKKQPTCPSVTVQGEEIEETVTGNAYKFTVYPPEKSVEVNKFQHFLQQYFLPDLNSIEHSSYRLSSGGCAGIEHCKAQVQVFPTWGWNGSVTMGYCYDENVNSNKADGAKRAQWAIEAGIKGRYDTQTWELKADTGKETNDYFPSLYDTLKDMTRRIDALIECDGLDEHGNRIRPKLVDVNLQWPKIALSGDVQLRELRSRYEVGLVGNVALSLDPLIQANVTIDIIGWLFTAGPEVYSGFLKKVRNQAAKGVGNDKVGAQAVIRLDLTINGALKGELSWDKPSKAPWKGQSSGQAQLTLKLKGEAHGELRFFYVKVAAGVEVSIASLSSESEGIGGIVDLKAVVAEGKPALDGCVKFTGAAIYYTAYVEAASKDMDSDEREASYKRRRGGKAKTDSSTNLGNKKKDMKKLVDILPEARFPKKPGRYTLDKVDL